MFLKPITFLLFCLMALNSHAQFCVEITGKVVDTSYNPLPSTIVEITFLGHTKFAITNNQGFFKQKICYANDSINKLPISVATKIIGYHNTISSFVAKSPTVDVGNIIKHQNLATLSEVIVKNKPITQHGDTTSFTVGAFKNRLDANLEDVLKKMPGFDIDANGTILYNNKPIEDILIEGDQLAKNYKLISKNINPDMVDKVDMIDKYNSNPVLKGLSNSRKQVMNLKLKNSNKINVFGEAKPSVGIEDKYGISGNLFALKAKLKTLILLNANNLGQSPYEEITTTDRSSENRDYEFDNTLMPNYIYENGLFTKSEFTTNSNVANSTLFNASRLAVINNTVRFNPKSTLKIFTDAYKDDITKNQQNAIINNIKPQFSYNEKLEKKYSPFNSNNNLQYKYLSKKIQIITAGTLVFKNYNEFDTITSNISYQSNQNAQYKRLGASSFITYRLDSTKAFEIGLQYSFDSKHQFYNVAQNVTRKLDTISTAEQLQQTENNIDYIKGEVKYLFKSKKRAVNILSINNTYFHSNFTSNLDIKSDVGLHLFLPQFQNSIATSGNKLLLNYNTGFKIKKIDILLDLGVQYSQFNNQSEMSKVKQENVQLVPKLNIAYSINSKSTISYNGSYNSNLQDLSALFDNSVLSSYRSFNKNIPSINNINNLRTSFSYLYRDITKATFFVASYFHSIQLKSNVSNVAFTKDFDTYTNRFIATPQVNSNIYLKLDKYLYSINTAFTLKNSFSWFANPIEVNNDILSSENFSYNCFLSLRPTIKDNINVNLGVDYRINKDILSKKSSYQLNPFIDVTSVLSKKLSVGIKANYFNTNYAVDTKNYYFVNANIWYSIVPNKLEAKLGIVNLLNQDVVYSGNRSDVITQFSETRILPRFALIECRFKF